MTIRFIGDIHGKYEEYINVKSSSTKSIQVGDFGFGFSPVPEDLFRDTDRYILGNHDNPFMGRNDPHHLESGNEWEGVFPINGAMSSDRVHRIEGKSWWKEEEHTTDQFYHIHDLWEQSKSEIVVAHDCPQDFMIRVNSHHAYENSKTRQFLSSLIYIRKPKIFIFGHHHMFIDEVMDGIRYICLPELGYIDI